MKNGIVYQGKTYKDVEEAYQKNKNNFPIGEARDTFMLNLLEIKLRTYPRLIEEIRLKGGIDYLRDSTHQPTKKNSHWETGGNNAFIKLLTQAFVNVTGTPQIVQPKQLDLFNQEDLLTSSPVSKHISSISTIKNPFGGAEFQTNTGFRIILADGSIIDLFGGGQYEIPSESTPLRQYYIDNSRLPFDLVVELDTLYNKLSKTQPEQTEEDWTKPCDNDIPF